MPAIRDGRGKLVVHDMGVPPPGSPSGPVERRLDPSRATGFHVEPDRPIHRGPTAEERARAVQNGAAARVASIATERAGPAHSDAGRSSEPRSWKPKGPGSSQRGQRREDRDERAKLVLEALERHEGDVAATAAELGVRANVVSIVAKHARIRGGAAPAAAQAAFEREAVAALTEAVEAQPEPSSMDPEYSEPQPAPAEPPIAVALVDVFVPCVDCAHAVVCSIREGLVAWANAFEAPATPDPAIRVQAMSVDCDHFLEAAS